MIDVGFDICISINPHSDHDRLVYTELAPNSRQLVVTPEYLAALGALQKPTDLNQHWLITQITNSSSNYWHFRDGSGIQTIHTRGHLMLDNGDAMLRAVLNNGGIAMLPTYITARHISAVAVTSILGSLIRSVIPSTPPAFPVATPFEKLTHF